MLRKAWYAVLPSHEVSDSPIKVTVHGMDFVLTRDNIGNLRAFNAYCPHRGCDLSLGSMLNEELVCPFHGWRFNSRGYCTHIPANGISAIIPPKAKLTVYPARDEAGLIWIHTYPLSQVDEQPCFINFPEFEANDWRFVPFETVWNTHFSRVVESVLDVSHLPFVHPESTGSNISPVVEGPDYSASKSGIVIHPTPFAPSHPMQPVLPPNDIEEQTEIELQFPNKWIIRTPIGNEKWMCTFLTFTPVNDETTHIFGIAMRNFELDSSLLDMFHIDHTHFVMNQDKEIIERLRPMMAPDLHKEVHVSSDGPTIRFRKMLFQTFQEES